MTGWQICARCGRRFAGDRFNRHHQRYCRRAECVRERKRERQRNWYRRHYGEDRGFRERERRRGVAGIRRRRRRVPLPPMPSPVEVLAGLVAQVCDVRSPAELNRVLAGYAERGRRYAIGTAAGVSPPGA